METEKDQEKFNIFEWTIENFTCWNKEIHGYAITSPYSCNFVGLYMKLYPLGLNGSSEKIVVIIVDGGYDLSSGDLSFIFSDGSLICRQQVASAVKGGILEYPLGPNFQEVVTRIRENEDLHEDKLTVRFRKKYHSNYTEYMLTTIGVFEVFLKMSRMAIAHLDSVTKTIYWINYQENGQETIFYLEAYKVKTETSKIVLILNQSSDIFILVRSVMFVQNDKNETLKLRTEENIFGDGRKWELSIDFTSKEIADIEKGKISLIINLKIITPSTSYKYPLQLLKIGTYSEDIFTPIRFKPHLSSSSSIKRSSTGTSNLEDDSVTVLTNQLMCLYQDQDHSDFVLKCDNVSIPVHKAILSARSPVFKSMLSCDMLEAASGCMDIGDMDPSTLACFLTFLYTGGVEGLQSESALNLYYAADKYQVPTLKKECSNCLLDSVSISNVCDILSLANRHQDEILIAVAREFILNNYNEVLSSENWKSFMKIEPLLVAETLTYFAEKKCVGKKMRNC